MSFLGERRERRIESEINEGARRVAGAVLEKQAEGETPPYTTYAWVQGLDGKDTARRVGQAAIDILGGKFLIDAQATEEMHDQVREGAFISFVRAE